MLLVMAKDAFDFEFLSWKDFLAGWISGICSITVGHPLETIKVRQQMTPNSISATRYATTMMKNEGMRCFFRGLSYPLWTTGVTNSIYFGFYANSLRIIENFRNEKHYRNCCDHGLVYRGWHWDCFVAGCIGGTASTLVNIPVELAKTVCQAHVRDSPNMKHSNPSSVLQDLFKSSGIRGCYHGGWILMIRDAPLFGVYALSYEHITCLLKPKHGSDQFTRILCEGIAGGSSGVITWAIAIPIDVIKNRYMSDCYSKKAQYTGLLDCVRKTYRQHGLSAFSQGLGTATVRAFPVNLICFVVYEQTLRYL